MRQTRKRFGNAFTVTKVGIPKYRVSDCVRISKAKPPVYRLADWHGERLAGTFYEPEPEPELQKVVMSKDKTYRIEEILLWRNKRREAFVKWFGWPTAFNSWIDAKTLVDYSM